MHEAGTGEIGDMVRERKMRIKINTEIENWPIRDESSGRRDIFYMCVKGSEISSFEHVGLAYMYTLSSPAKMTYPNFTYRKSTLQSIS